MSSRASRSAPASSSALTTEGVVLLSAASCRGVFWNRSRASKTPPASSSRETTEADVLDQAARCRGVVPSPVRAFGLALASSSTAMIAGVVLNAAAWCRGVFPYESFDLTLAPASSSALTTQGRWVVFCRKVQRRRLASSLCVQVGSGVHERLDNRGGCAEPRRRVQRRPSELVLRVVHISSSIQERPDD